MTGSAEREVQALESLPALLSGAVADAVRAARGFAGGIYLRSSTPGLLRMAVLAGLPNQLFRPWWRMHVDRPFPVADVHRLGEEVLLTDATETMRRYPQLAAGLPFPFGSLYVPVVGGSTPFGVLTVLRPSASDATEVLPDRDRMTAVAEELGAALAALDKNGPGTVTWDDEPLNVPAPADGPSAQCVGAFTWDPYDGTVTADDPLATLLRTAPGASPARRTRWPTCCPGRIRACSLPRCARRPPGARPCTRCRCAPQRAGCACWRCGPRKRRPDRRTG